jgi:hypothetical protein
MTLAQRWQAWRASRRVVSGAGIPRQDSPPRTTPGKHFDARPAAPGASEVLWPRLGR